MRRVAVVGGGLAGLVAARELAATGASVVVLEAAAAVGGKLRSAEVGGVLLDVGAESMLARRPEGVELVRSLGLPVVHPAVQRSGLWIGGSVRPLPRTLMGVPLDVDELRASGVLSDTGVARVVDEQPGVPVEEDLTVAELVGSRLGEEVVDRLVEPLLGGVYAGHARHLSVRATVPQLVELAARGRLTDADPPPSDEPIFAGVTDGLASLVDALAGEVDVRTAATVRELERTPSGFALVIGPTTGPERVEVDAVVLAAPAAAAARLLRHLTPDAAAELGEIEYASLAIVTLAFRDADVVGIEHLSGFLVPPIEGRSIKASTFSSSKWGWVRERGAEQGLFHLRTSLGRHREEAALQVPDEELVATSLADLRDAVGITAAPADAHVQRWGGGLPQYAVGHLDRVARIREAVARVPGLAVCGAAYDGVGIPAVIASAQRAARDLTSLGTMGS